MGSSVQRCQPWTSGELNGCYHDTGDDKPTTQLAQKLCPAGHGAVVTGKCSSATWGMSFLLRKECQYPVMMRMPLPERGAGSLGGREWRRWTGRNGHLCA